MKKEYNTTDLDPAWNFERGVYHRDMFAHYLRWAHIANRWRVKQKILDVGCGKSHLCKVFYHNKCGPTIFHGVDVRASAIERARNWNADVNFPTKFEVRDVVKDILPQNDWDLICFLEVLEHIPKKYGRRVLENLRVTMNGKTRLMLSTPCFNGRAAKNHIVNGEICEYEYEELKKLLNEYFIIENHWGNMTTNEDIKDLMAAMGYGDLYDKLHSYYDHHMLAIVFAPAFPRFARGCMWELRKK